MSNIEEFPGNPLLPGIGEEYMLGTELLESEESQRARYSGKIVDKNLGRVHQILAARAMGLPVRQVCSGFKVSPHTLAELEHRHRVKLATLKERLARKFGVFVELGIDRAIAEVDRIDIDKLLVSLGIAADKLQVLTGEPTMIVGNGESSRQFSVDTLRSRLRPVIDITPARTGLVGGENPATREDSRPAGPAAGCGDNQSLNDHA